MIGLRFLMYLVYSPCTPWGRVNRIEHLMNDIGENREVCATIVYSRDLDRHLGFTFTSKERKEALHLLALLDSGHIRMPADRNKE